MDEDNRIIELYIAQLQEIGHSEDEANELGQILYAGAETFSEMFGINPDEYLEKRFAGYSGMTQAQFRRRLDTFFKYETLEPEALHGREYRRDDFIRRPDSATAKVVFLENQSIPQRTIGEMVKYIMEILEEQGGPIEIKSTKQIVESSKEGLKSCIVKKSRGRRNGSEEHRNAYAGLREMIANAEYWYSMWSKVKSIIKKMNPRNFDAVWHAMNESFWKITPANLCGWYRNCGYFH